MPTMNGSMTTHEELKQMLAYAEAAEYDLLKAAEELTDAKRQVSTAQTREMNAKVSLEQAQETARNSRKKVEEWFKKQVPL